MKSGCHVINRSGHPGRADFGDDLLRDVCVLKQRRPPCHALRGDLRCICIQSSNIVRTLLGEGRDPERLPADSELLKLVRRLVTENPQGLGATELARRIASELTAEHNSKEVLTEKLRQRLYKILQQQTWLQRAPGMSRQTGRSGTEYGRRGMVWQLRGAGIGKGASSTPKGFGQWRSEQTQLASVAADIRRLVPSRGIKYKKEEREFWVDVLARVFVGRLGIVSLRGVLLPAWSEKFGGMSLDWSTFIPMPSPVDTHELLLGTVNLDSVVHTMKLNREITELERKNWLKRLEILKRFEDQFRRWYPILNKLSYPSP